MKRRSFLKAVAGALASVPILSKFSFSKYAAEPEFKFVDMADCPTYGVLRIDCNTWDITYNVSSVDKKIVYDDKGSHLENSSYCISNGRGLSIIPISDRAETTITLKLDNGETLSPNLILLANAEFNEFGYATFEIRYDRRKKKIETKWVTV